MPSLSRCWLALKPSDHARRGIILALASVILIAGSIGAWNIESGFGRLLDFAAAALAAAICLPAVIGLAWLLLSIAAKLPRLLTGLFLASALMVWLVWFGADAPAVSWLLASGAVFLECALGAAIATLVRGGLRNAPAAKRVVTFSILLAACLANLEIAWLFLSSRHPAATLEPALDKPVARGPYQVRTLYYGSGDSARRPEFGPAVAIRTNPVNAEAFFDDPDGWRPWLRRRYWGFGLDRLPLNAQVYYPAGRGPFPIFVMVHGNHNMSVPSDQGYGYLCDLLASRGFIAVSIDENFLNDGLLQKAAKEQAVRGWLILEHLRLWHAWARDPKNPFFGKIDLDRIALAGHSRGGEAAATAALFNTLAYLPDDASIPFHYGYKIGAVIEVAAPDGQYRPAGQWRTLKDVSFLALQGANDSDIVDFQASRQYEHVTFSGAIPAFKAELYIEGANHSRFNTLWGEADTQGPRGWLLNRGALISARDQRRIAALYVSAFLDQVFGGKGRRSLPRALYLNRYQDESYRTICGFTEDPDLTTTTMPGGRLSAKGFSTWREGPIPFRAGSREYNGVFLGWNRSSGETPARYSIDLAQPEPAAAVDLSVAVTGDDGEEPTGATSFSVEVEDAAGERARAAGSAAAPFPVQFTKLGIMESKTYGAAAQPVFQTLRLPLAWFHKINPNLNPDKLRSIRLIFDRTRSGAIIISGIGLDGA